MPDHIDNLFDELESTPPNRVPAFIRRLASEDAGWLAKYIHAKVLKEKENSSEVVERELAVGFCWFSVHSYLMDDMTFL